MGKVTTQWGTATLRATVLVGVVATSALLPSPGCLDRRDEGASPGSAEGQCASCHGEANRSGDRLQRAAPPHDLSGSMDTAHPGVGAHEIHVYESPTHEAIACNECHVVPEAVDSLGHADDWAPAELTFGSLARTSGNKPAYDPASRTCADSYCHGSSEPTWTEPRSSDDACGSCHGLPPPAPHPQMAECSTCHGSVVGADSRTILDRTRHVDGVVDVAAPPGCTGCHGSENAAPPADLEGIAATSSPGVGAHQTHVLGTASSRAVDCGDCHRVPVALTSQGHVDTALPAEVVFSGVAAAYGGAPSYAAGTCQQSSCHGGVFPKGHASGGTNLSPQWTVVNGTQATCGSCHALPPPAPHPKAELNPTCSACHENIASDNATFVRPDLHVDGIVTFEIP